MANIAFNIEIMTVHKQDKDEEKDEDFDSQNMLGIVNYDICHVTKQICHITKQTPVGINLVMLQKKLVSMCDENNSDVILIIGDIGFIEKQLITEAIKSVIDDEDFISEAVAITMLHIKRRLIDIMPRETACGIRNRSLIIDLSGPITNVRKYFEAIRDLILKLINLLRMKEDHDLSLHEIESIVDSIEQMEPKLGIKRRKKCTSPISSPDIIKHYKESFPMISMTDALSKIDEVILSNKISLEGDFETVQLSDAYGRIICETVGAAYDLPPFKASTKHGYAVLVTDGKGLRKVLKVQDTFSISLEPGTCVWVKTGAPIPDGATAVVPERDTRLVEKSESSNDKYIEIMVEPQNEQNIKPVGYDLMKGKPISIPYTRIGPNEIALLAASGCKEIRVAKHISIGVLSIGSNLATLEEPLKSGFIYDSNRITLISLLKEKGFHSLDFGIVDNNSALIQNKIEEALKEVNLLVTTGSTNNRDLLKTILENHFKADIHFGNVNMKPGKSTIFATCKIDDAKKYFLCLPGNPASAFVGAQIFLLPLVNKLCYNLHLEQTIIPARMEGQYTLHNRSRAAWTILEWGPYENCALAFSKGNGVADKLTSAVGANALLLLPRKETGKKVSCESMISALLVKLPKKINIKNFCNASK